MTNISELYEEQAKCLVVLTKIAWERSAAYAAAHVSLQTLRALSDRERSAIARLDEITKKMQAKRR